MHNFSCDYRYSYSVPIISYSLMMVYICDDVCRFADQQDYPGDCSLAGNVLPIRDFVLGSTHNIYAKITTKGTDINVIHRNHDSPIHAIVTHPSE